MIRYRLGTALAGIGMLALAGCSSSTGGNATPTTSAPTSTTSPTSPIAQELKALDPCSVISDSTASALHLTKIGRDDLTAPVSWGCKWQATPETVGAANSWSFLFSLFPGSGATDVNKQGATVTTVTTNGRQGLQLDNGQGTCTVTMAITDTSSAQVDLYAINNGQACTMARNIASVVEPKLPKS